MAARGAIDREGCSLEVSIIVGRHREPGEPNDDDQFEMTPDAARVFARDLIQAAALLDGESSSAATARRAAGPIDLTAVYSLTDACELLRCNRATVAKLIRHGELRARKIGRKYLIAGRAIRDYLDGADTPGGPAT